MGLELDGVNGIIKNSTSDGDVTIKGNDGGSEISALTFDMSAEGAATFNSSVTLKDAGGGAGAILNLTSTDTSGASGEFLGIINFVSSDSSTGSAGTQAAIKGVYEDNGDSSGLEFFTGNSTGSGTPTLQKRMQMFHDSGVTITTTDNTDTLTLASTDADANSGPNLRLYRNSGSPADDDLIGNVQFEGRNDNSQDVVYAEISSRLNDASDGTEDGLIFIKAMTGGTLTEYMRFDPGSGGIVVNDGSADMNFRVESNGQANMLFVDGGNDRVHVNGSTGTREFNVSGDNTRLLLYSTNNSTGAGQLQFGDADDEQIGRIMYEHDGNKMTFHTSATERLRIHSAGQLSTGGETDSNVDAGGLCLNTGANDGRTLSFKNSDIAHGITNVVQTDTYGFFEKKSATLGGLKIGGLVESGSIAGIELFAVVTSEDTDEASGAEGAIQTNSFLKSGTGTAGLQADGNAFVVRVNTTQFIVKADGELFSNQSATVGTFDEYDDAQLIRAYDLSHGKGVIDSSFDKFVKYNKDDLQKARLIGSDKEGNATPFVNITGMSRLHNGAIWQQYEKHQRLASAFYKLAEKTIGKEEADKLLTEEEIQLLN